MIEIFAQARLNELQGIDFILLVVIGPALAELIVGRAIYADIKWIRVDWIDAEGSIVGAIFAEGVVVVMIFFEPVDVARFALFGFDVVVISSRVERVVGNLQVIIVILLKRFDGFGTL